MTLESRQVGTLTAAEFELALASGIGLRIGPFLAHLRSDARALPEPLYRLYREYPLADANPVYSFHARLSERRARLPGRPAMLRFSVDGRVPHEDMPAGQALAVLEWGMNLVIALRSHRFLMLHAAVVARGDRALLLPAEPGFGKSTLCAALAHRGWQLYSDEFGLLLPESGMLVPVPRPVALKNESIRVLEEFAPDAEFGPSIHGTRKGTVAHLKAPRDAVAGMRATARPAWVVFPRWRASGPCDLVGVSRAEAFMRIATNAFNYELLGETGFAGIQGIVEQSRAYRLAYTDLDEALTTIERLADDGGQ